MKKRQGLNITLHQADEHQRKHGFPPLTGKTLCEVFTAEDKAKVAGKLRNVRKRTMNRTEREFHVILIAAQRRAEYSEVRYEGVRLLWGGGMTYTADFSAKRYSGRIVLFEVKGAHIRDRDIVRFKGCRHEWAEWFEFEFWQRTKDGQWTQLL